jgi:hypothetical protein
MNYKKLMSLTGIALACVAAFMFQIQSGTKVAPLKRVGFYIPPALADAAVDRLVLIKSLYYFVNGGAQGTWPDGANSALTGGNAPSNEMQNGFLGLINNITGPSGILGKFLETQGYTTCASLPSTDTSFTVTDATKGELSITIGPSTRAIPSGFTNTGTFEKRIFIKTVSGDVPVAAVHLSCSGTINTMLVRFDGEMDTVGQTERIEAIIEGSTSSTATDVHLEIMVNNGYTSGRDLALKFVTTDGDNYSIFLAFSSDKTDASGNGPAMILVGLNGTRSTSKAQLNVMGGNGSGAGSTSSDVAGLPYDATLTPDQFASGNQFCIDTTTGGTTTGCGTVASPGTPVVSGLTAWTMTAIAATRGAGNVVTTLNTTNY